jgi:hypothetical protein
MTIVSLAILIISDNMTTLAVCLLTVTDGPHKMQYGDTYYTNILRMRNGVGRSAVTTMLTTLNVEVMCT